MTIRHFSTRLARWRSGLPSVLLEPARPHGPRRSCALSRVSGSKMYSLDGLSQHGAGVPTAQGVAHPHSPQQVPAPPPQKETTPRRFPAATLPLQDGAPQPCFAGPSGPHPGTRPRAGEDRAQGLDDGHVNVQGGPAPQGLQPPTFLCEVCACVIPGDLNWALHLLTAAHRRKELIQGCALAGARLDPHLLSLLTPQNLSTGATRMSNEDRSAPSRPDEPRST
jgi:hypothetical protein